MLVAVVEASPPGKTEPDDETDDSEPPVPRRARPTRGRVSKTDPDDETDDCESPVSRLMGVRP